MNRLAHEQSPYLLQHQHNPVDWYPWGEEAFEKARAEDKPIFLSIGYATCHWCHVMAHESFEDEEVARLMNEAFVCVKVDREERPDVDGVYMTVCQMITGSGGWPLTILMTPEGQPFYAGTYLPKRGRLGRPGMLDLVPRIRAVWTQEREKIEASAGEITAILQEAASAPVEEGGLDEDALRLGFEQFRQRFDPQHGGFAAAPKFPTPHNLLFLLRYWRRTGEASALRMATHTLRQMRHGGLFDHVGYGFHRYSTDERWLLPHFEKMLYDQALLVMAYAEAFQATGDGFFARVARETLAYVLRDLRAPEGGFYSAEDADSEGREGAFYVWTRAELDAVLGAEAAAFAADVFGATAEGNFEDEATRRRTGENVLHLPAASDELAEAHGLAPDAWGERLEAIRRRLFEHREQRPRPLLDDKVLTDWNGLMIAALARAAQALGEPRYAEAAEEAARFLLTTLRSEDGRLVHRYRNGDAGLQANLDDYAFLTWGLLDLYETTFDPDHLAAAIRLTDEMLGRFPAEGGGFYFTPDDGEALIARQKETYDGAVPSGNSVALLNLLRLGRITGDARYDEAAEGVLRLAAPTVRRMPSAHALLLCGLDFAVGPTAEVVLASADVAGAEPFVQALRGAYHPSKVVLRRTAAAAERLAALAPFTAEQQPVAGQPVAYVCRDHACQAPTTDPQAMLAHLGGMERPA